MNPNIIFSQGIFSSGPRFELGVGGVLGTEFAADFVLASIIGLYLCSSIFPAETAVSVSFLWICSFGRVQNSTLKRRE